MCPDTGSPFPGILSDTESEVSAWCGEKLNSGHDNHNEKLDAWLKEPGREHLIITRGSDCHEIPQVGLADFVIVNDGETPLIPQVLGLITFLSQNNTYLCPPKK